MELLSADEAKKIVESSYNDDLHNILSSIKLEAEKGKSVLHLYTPLKEFTRKKLEELGYRIPPTSSIATQRDEIYASIHW